MVNRVYAEKKDGFDVEAATLAKEFQDQLGIKGLKKIRILNRYDVEGISQDVYQQAKTIIFSEPAVDFVYDEEVDLKDGKVFATEYLPGQYDQRADSAMQCIQILTKGQRPAVKTAKVYALYGEVSDQELEQIKDYCINPVEAREASLEKPETLQDKLDLPSEVAVIEGFRDVTDYKAFIDQYALAMDENDLKFSIDYFKKEEQRDPTLTELRMIDTYWSDHCRHTTFTAHIDSVEFEDGGAIKKSYDKYQQARKTVHAGKHKPECLMDIATIAAKELKQQGYLQNLDVSEEINACSIEVMVDVDGKEEKWLVMFKNETHNHPTEIEPFGGAATCLGGAIRDPLSGRSYVYQAMRVTGSGDPTAKLSDTMEGKLSQKKITTGAAHGYSSYGNQIGLATGHVREIYHPGYVAKRMEIGAVIAAAPKENVVRKQPEPGDLILLLGGKTGRDGCGGATGSSKAHTEKSLETCAAEVQKGNPPEERKIQRLFRNPDASRLIKRCNDFGAGGVSVAVGELADGLKIDLDKVPKKYEGLDGTELAISESQERMAVVVDPKDVDTFKALAKSENLETTVIAEVTAQKRLVMYWQGKQIVNLSREFMNSNGAEKHTKVKVTKPNLDRQQQFHTLADLPQVLEDLNSCSQKGLAERFDSTIGAGTVVMPFGGKYQLTPEDTMCAKIPLLKGNTETCTFLSYGFDPYLSEQSPYHGAVYAVTDSMAKLAASGADITKAYLTFQEYFRRLGTDPENWGRPYAALLGAYEAQIGFHAAAIGGKDSMSGTFKDLNVPNTLVSFAVAPGKTSEVITCEFKRANSKVYLLVLPRDEENLPDFAQANQLYGKLYQAVKDKKVLSAKAVGAFGYGETIAKMCFGNKIGFTFARTEGLFDPMYGNIVVEAAEELDFGLLLGTTSAKLEISDGKTSLSIDSLVETWQSKLLRVFPETAKADSGSFEVSSYDSGWKVSKPAIKIAKPKVFIPIFPGTNCEYDTKRRFEQAGAAVTTSVFANLTPDMVDESIERFASHIRHAQIVMIPGGFSAGDEPEGSGKFIATVFKNPKIAEAVMDLLQNRDGLMLGICNGFQALIKLGLLPYGEIRDLDETAPTLTFNLINRHVSTMVETKIASNLSPWLANAQPGKVYTIPVSHGEGRFVADEKTLETLAKQGQIATQYVDLDGQPTMESPFNPNGSCGAVEGITSPDGRVLGKMGHSERIGQGLYQNIPGEFDQGIFEAGVAYFQS